MSQKPDQQKVLLEDILKEFPFYGSPNQIERLASYAELKLAGRSVREINDTTGISYGSMKRFEQGFDSLSDEERRRFLGHIKESI